MLSKKINTKLNLPKVRTPQTLVNTGVLSFLQIKTKAICKTVFGDMIKDNLHLLKLKNIFENGNQHNLKKISP